MPSFAHDGLEFHYLDRGGGLPVFFQHGLGGQTEKTLALLELPPGFRLLGMDCRGHGQTTPLGPPEKLRFDSFGDDLVALMDRLDISRAVMGGTSMGAGVALNCALRYPGRVLGLILLRPAWLDRPNQANANLFGLIARLMRQHGREPGLERFMKTETYEAIASESADTAGSLVGLFQDQRGIETVARLERLPEDAPNWDKSEWRSIRLPTLILSTRQDPVHPFEFAQLLAREIPGAQLRELTPKSVNLDRYTSELCGAVAKFLHSPGDRRWTTSENHRIENRKFGGD